MEVLWQDLRYGARMLLKNLGFTITAVLVLALGIGANSAIFSIVSAVLLRPLPYEDSSRLVSIWETDLKKGRDEMPASPPTFMDWKSQQQNFKEMAAYFERSHVLMGGDEPSRVKVSQVSVGFFSVLEIQPVLGRAFLVEEDQVNGRRVAVLSHQLWQERFGADKAIIGRNVILSGDNDEDYEVIGIAPPGFKYPNETVIWTPLIPAISRSLSVRGAHMLEVLGRLKPESTLEKASVELNTITRRIAHSDANYSDFGVRLLPLQEQITGKARRPLLILTFAVGFVLLIACANLANLFLTRAASRQSELATRVAMGAGRRRLIRQLMTETLLLSLIGGGLGMLFAAWGVQLLIRLSHQDLPRMEEISLNWQVVAFTLVISLLTGVISGLAPAFQYSRSNLSLLLKGGGIHYFAGVMRLGSFRSLLLISEIALAFVLLVGAGLLIKNFMQLVRLDLGFNPERVLTFTLFLPDSRYPQWPQQAAFFQQVKEGIASLPGVHSVAASRNAPLAGSSLGAAILIEGRPAEKGKEHLQAQYDNVSPDYFQTMGIPLIQGRPFTEQDNSEAAAVAIINDAFARSYFPGETPIGKRLRVIGFGKGGKHEIVGVVGDVRHSGPAANITPQIYAPYLQNPMPFLSFVIRANVPPADLSSSVRKTVFALDPTLPVDRMSTMEELFSKTVAQPRFYMSLLSIFALAALVLAAIGVYGIVSYSATQRTREIGIRMALGAERRDVFKLIVGQYMVRTIIGVVVGMVVAMYLTRFVTSLLFGVSATDHATFIGVTLLLISVALLACYIPARRAARVDPIVALRYE